MKVRYTPAALADIDKIYRNIAIHNPLAAQRVEDKLRETAEGFEHFPGIGAPTDIAQVRRFPVARFPYTIFYRVNPTDDAVEILRVIHSARVTAPEQLLDDD
jgi:plasmid stabilization system protein ParE